MSGRRANPSRLPVGAAARGTTDMPGKYGQAGITYLYRDGWPWLATQDDQIIMRRDEL
ncbi:hypothetical protein DFAR_800005 [Desulfarculales bacterium]